MAERVDELAAAAGLTRSDYVAGLIRDRLAQVDSENVPPQRVVISTTHAGFALSDAALALLRERGVDAEPEALPRDHPDLVEIVKELGSAAGGETAFGMASARLAIAEVPAGLRWTLAEYDGVEWVAEAHRRWDANGEIPAGTTVPRRQPEESA